MSIPPELPDRSTEWFVPRIGPRRFRIAVGLLFLPYTGMVLAFTVIGAMLAPQVYWDRVVALLVIYFLALGIGAHALDAIGSKASKPWGETFSRRQLWILGGASLGSAYLIGAYYMWRDAALLWPIAIAEGFFVLAYNLEWFAGRFHTDRWFALSWGALPVLAGFVLQTNALALAPVIIACAAALLSLVEINASRPYKRIRQAASQAVTAARAPLTSPGGSPEKADLQGAEALDVTALGARLEAILKCISGGVILLGAGLALLRWQTG
jgi:hypothetical protein